MVQTSSITMPNAVEIVGRAPAVNERVWCVFACFLFVTLWNDELVITKTLWSSIIFKTINYGVIAYKVCNCAPIFNFFCGPPKFSIWSKLIQKIPRFLAILGAVSPHFKSHNGEIWHEDTDLGLRPQAKCCIKKVAGGGLFGQNYTKKLPILAILGAVSALLKVTMVKFGVRVRTCDCLPHAKVCKNHLRGYTPLRKIYTKNKKKYVLSNSVCPMQPFHFWSHDVHPVQNLMLCTKFHENPMIFYWQMAIFRFSKWRPSAILELFYYHTRPPTKSLLLAAAACQTLSIWYTDLNTEDIELFEFSHIWLEMLILAPKMGVLGDFGPLNAIIHHGDPKRYILE